MSRLIKPRKKILTFESDFNPLNIKGKQTGKNKYQWDFTAKGNKLKSKK